ncbi:MAG: hypothetical protein JNK58_11465 [Phycisphaerae bacterium]|nr:hypothetical protein [Phycisphaerae bacterium]
MNTKLLVITVVVLVSMTASHARVSVSIISGQGTYNVDSKGGDVYELTLETTYTSDNTTFVIAPSSASDVIEFIRVDSKNPGQETILFIGSAQAPFLEIKEISLTNDEGFTWIGSVNVGTLRRVEVNGLDIARVGDLLGPVDLKQHDARPTFIFDAEVTGRILGDILLEDNGSTNFGTIERLYVIGTVGTDETPVSIRVGGAIGWLKAEGIFATIKGTGEDGVAQFVRGLGEIFTDADPFSAFPGVIRGEIWGVVPSLNAEQTLLAGYIRAAGDLEANVYLGTSLADPSNFGNDVRAGAAGLKGAIIVNSFAGTGVWTAPVKIGTGGSLIQLIPSSFTDAYAYPNTAASLGGGSVGVVPFKLHRTDCFPPQEADGDILAIDPPVFSNYVLMRHYGPVTWDEEADAPFKVFRRKAGSSDSWLPQDCFDVTPAASNKNIVVVSKGEASEYATGTFQRGFDYMVERQLDGGVNILRSDLPHLDTENDPEVADYAGLVFRVCDAAPYAWAPGDADDNGIVDRYDVDCVLENWNSTDCMKPGDADRDGYVDSADLFAAELYEYWEYCYAEPLAAMKSADGFSTMDVESESAAMSEPMTLSRALGAMGYADAADFGQAFTTMSDPARNAARNGLMALLSGE